MSILLVAGLGNPGREYEKTRHNAGFVVVDALARKHGLAWQNNRSFQADTARWDTAPGGNVLLVKPLTFMNESGRAVQSLASYYKIPASAIMVVYDDFNIEVGHVKISLQGSAGGHNGIASIIERFGVNFARYRIGIGPKSPPEMDIKDYVLGNFTNEQQTIINNQLNHYLHGIELLLTEGADRAMNQLNRRTNTQ